MCFPAQSQTFIHLQAVFQNSLSSSSVEAEITTFSNAIIMIGSKPSVNSFAAMGILEKTKCVYLCQVATFKIGIISFFDDLTFIFPFLSVPVISILEQGRSNYNCLVPGRTSALFLPLGAIII